MRALLAQNNCVGNVRQSIPQRDVPSSNPITKAIETIFANIDIRDDISIRRGASSGVTEIT
jgi:hypothetical protein